MSSTVILKASGLQTSPTELAREEGALIQASNVIIRRDNMIEPRRGVKLFGTQLPLTNERVKQLTTYRNRIIRHYSDKLQFDSTGNGDFFDFDGSFMETSLGLRMKFVESNGNLYFTTANGIKKMSARTADDFTINADFVVPAGAIKAVDLTGKVIYTANSQSAWFPQDSAVAYRVLWAYKDLNNNLIQGAPSQRLVLSNPMTDLLLQDYMRVLSVLDGFVNSPLTSARIDNKNYLATLGLNLTSSASTLQANLLSLTTKIDNDILYANQAATAPLGISSSTISSGICTINFSTGDARNYFIPGSKVLLAGFTPVAQSEIQKVSFSVTPTSGNFRLKYGANETADILWNASAAVIQIALRLVAGMSNVVVTGSVTSGTGLTLTFPSTDGNLNQVIPGTVNTLSPASVITTSTTQEGIATPSGTLNGAQEVVTIDLTAGAWITFNTSAIGGVTLASATINSNEYRSLTQPSVPSTPATNAELVEIQTYISDIILQLSSELATVISVADQVAVSTLDVTTTATTELIITIPEGINSNYFMQVYRSSIAQATGAATFDDVFPSDELQLVYEAYPTTTELSSGFITFEDITSDAFRGANLYTNASTGSGILDANEPPPFAKDLTRYRNSVFYANTRTRQRMDLNLLGITQMIVDYNNSIIPTITTSNGTINNTYQFILGTQQIVDVTTTAGTLLDGKYFNISSTNTDYYVWYNTGASVDPAISGRTGIEVAILVGDTATQVAIATYNKIVVLIADFIVTRLTNVLTIRNLDAGYAGLPSVGTSAFTISTMISGKGEAVRPEITTINAIAGNLYKSSGTADYFKINSTGDQRRYYIWFNRGTATNPALAGYSALSVVITGAETATQVATLIKTQLDSINDFLVAANLGVLTVTNAQYGACTAATETVLNAGFTITRTQVGALEVLLSPLTSPARAVDETARSFIRVINKNPEETIYGYYISSTFDVPGKMSIEARSLDLTAKFYIVGNNDNTGVSFNPDIGPEVYVSSTGTGSEATIITTTPHGFNSGDQIMVTNSNSIPLINGLSSITVTGTNSFFINDSYIVVAGTRGSIIKATNSVYSENEEKSNRVYYSKFQQPEAVPLINYFDVGSADKAILRILPLRNSLFVFKEDGLYRISGESSPFQLELFDISFNMLAPDSATVCNNVIYSWTTQGIQSLTEGGASIVSRNIDNIILKTQSANYTNFRTITWGIGYESDNSYTVYTASKQTDTVPTIAYRYSTLTNSWTTLDLSHNAGVINSADDKLYLASTDVAYIEQERKTFSRLDYADRELDSVISANKVIGNKIILPSVTGLDIGDVFVQNQTVNTFQFNTMLNKLDSDSGVSDNDYLATLSLVTGASPRTQLTSLATKLDGDAGVNYNQFFNSIDNKTGVITANTDAASTIVTSAGHGLLTGRIVIINSSNSVPVINGTYMVTVIDINRFSIPIKVTVAGTAGNFQTANTNFDDIKACYNFVMNTLNNDTGVSFNNYKTINDNTSQETIITAINTITKQITLNVTLQYLVGDVTIFKAFESVVTYSPVTMGDPLMLKHLREATVMFENRTFSGGILSFATDLLPEFIQVAFKFEGNGIFGHSNFGTGFFGGMSNSAPFRTYIPRQCQRCRYMFVRFAHKTAREEYKITGCTLTGEIGQSTRTYR